MVKPRPPPPPDAEGDIEVPVEGMALQAHWSLRGDDLRVTQMVGPWTGGKLDPDGGSPEDQAKAMLLAAWIKRGGKV